MAILNIKNIDVYVVFSILILFGLIEAFGGLYGKKSKRSKNDWYVELFSTFHLFVFIKPIIFFSTTYFLINILPQYRNIFSDATFWISSLIVIFGDDFYSIGTIVKHINGLGCGNYIDPIILQEKWAYWFLIVMQSCIMCSCQIYGGLQW